MLLDLFALIAVIFTLTLMLSAAICLFSRVPYVPTRKKLIPKLLKVAKLQPGTPVCDLGCGDGRLLFAAEKLHKIKGTGFELSPIAFFFAISKKLLFRSHVHLHFQNFFHASLQEFRTIFVYLTPQVLAKLVPKFQKECAHGTTIISHTFHVEGLKPAKIIAADPKNRIPIIYIYKF